MCINNIVNNSRISTTGFSKESPKSLPDCEDEKYISHVGTSITTPYVVRDNNKMNVTLYDAITTVNYEELNKIESK